MAFYRPFIILYLIPSARPHLTIITQNICISGLQDRAHLCIQLGSYRISFPLDVFDEFDMIPE